MLRVSRRFASGFLPMVIPAIVMWAGAPAVAAPYNPLRLPADQVAGIDRICGGVMGLSRGEQHFQSCVDSLMRDADEVDRGQDFGAARSACLSAGLSPGQPALAECELRRGEVARTLDAPIDADVGAPVKSYFYASNDEVRRRERMACARLGLEPAGAAFNSCVASLQGAMFQADNPQN